MSNSFDPYNPFGSQQPDSTSGGAGSSGGSTRHTGGYGNNAAGGSYDGFADQQGAGQNQYGTGQYGAGQYGAGQYGAEQYGAGQYGAGQYGAEQYGSGQQYGTDQFGVGQQGAAAATPYGQDQTGQNQTQALGMNQGNTLYGPGQPQYGPPQQPGDGKLNILGIVSIALAVLGTILSFFPATLVMGWIMLPIAFVVGIIGLAMKDLSKGTAIAGVITAIVGGLISLIVFFVAASFASNSAAEDAEDNAPVESADGEAESGGDAASAGGQSADNDDKAKDKGKDKGSGEGSSRENPLPLGSTVAEGDWEVTINSVNLDATEEIMKEEPFNEEPEDGMVYIMVNMTAKYTGDESQGENPLIPVSYVSPGGKTYESYDVAILVPDRFEVFTTLYNGGDTTGNIGLSVPAEDLENGTIVVEPGLYKGDKIFYAVK
nr:Telomeric repeat-binding factor 2 [Streptococcus thermophilus]